MVGIHTWKKAETSQPTTFLPLLIFLGSSEKKDFTLRDSEQSSKGSPPTGKIFAAE